jgi:hypothetical protein
MIKPCSRILSHKQMRDTRERIGFCYLCGENLPSRDKPGYRQEIIGEHVIPRSLLGDIPAKHPQAWAVELNVHRKCEQSGKQHVDHWLKLLQEVHVKPADRWAKPGHLGNLPIYPSQVIRPDTGEILPAFSGCRELFEGVWRWIRGMHASLYLQFLPDNIRHFSYPPVPVCSSQSSGPTIEETETQTHLILSIISHAESQDKWDGITAWCDLVRYRCVWWQLANRKYKASWICFWTLTFPYLEEWSRKILKHGSERPWHGNYFCETRPSNGTWLRREDLRIETKESPSEVIKT